MTCLSPIIDRIIITLCARAVAWVLREAIKDYRKRR